MIMEITWYLQLNSGTSKKEEDRLKKMIRKKEYHYRFENNLSEKIKNKKAKTHFPLSFRSEQ